MEESIFPSARSFGDDEEIEEERRLCYVGITRAKVHLWLTCAKTRTLFGSTKYNLESRFIKEIPEELIERKMEEVKRVDPSLYASVGQSRPSFDQSSMLHQTQQKPAPSANHGAASYQVGDKVKHRKFGIGTVISAQAMGADSLLKIQFEVGEKNLMAAYARLEKAE